MSMTVDNVSYLTGTRQNTHISAAEKQEHERVSLDVSKTQRSSVSASLDQVNMGKDGIAVTEVSRQQGAEQYEAEDLSEYTDSELKQMYYKGEITRQEYEDETGKILE